MKREKIYTEDEILRMHIRSIGAVIILTCVLILIHIDSTGLAPG